LHAGSQKNSSGPGRLRAAANLERHGLIERFRRQKMLFKLTPKGRAIAERFQLRASTLVWRGVAEFWAEQGDAR
jgi:Mn-dependent DtxR family transcriptional regulator